MDEIILGFDDLLFPETSVHEESMFFMLQKVKVLTP
jgi:hypothetical protein